MNIAINVGGYHNIGTGHVYRQIAMMEEYPDLNYIFLITKEQNLAQKVLEENLIDYTYYENNKEFIEILDNQKINIVINDILDTNRDFMKSLYDNNYFTVNYEDRGEGIQYADIVINDMYPIDNYKELKNVYIGTEYTCMRRDLILYKAKSYNDTPKKLIITFGGSDPSNYTKRVLDIILEKEIYKSIQVVFILGLGYKYDDDILKHKSKNIKVFKNIKNMASILRKGDIAITSNGRTLLELAYFEVPCISLAQNDREATHVHAKIENGVIFLGRKNEFTDDILYEKLNKLLTDNKYRYDLSIKMKKVKEKLLNSNKKIWSLILEKYKYEKTMVILQCRLNSSRLPNKAIKLIQDKEMITHQIKRLQKCRNISDIVLCTSTNTENNDLISIANKLGIKSYRGSENNVLDRFYTCAKNFKLKHIIRCTGDCPLIDPNLVDSLVNEYFKNKYLHLNFRNKDITRNNQFPDGFDAEIFSVDALEEAWINDKSAFGTEHVTPYIVKKYGKNYFKIPKTEKYTNIDFTNFHLSVDTHDDFVKVKYIYDNLYQQNNHFTLYDILDFLN